MRVDQATVEDIPAIVALGYEVLGKSIYAGVPADEIKFKKTVAMLIGSKLGCVLVVRGDNGQPAGFLIGVVDELFFSKKRYATDLCMYVMPAFSAYGAHMVRRFVNWAKTVPGVVDITLGISSGMDTAERTGEMYERMGFTRVGGLYTKRVGE